MKTGTKEYFSKYYQKNKDKHNENMKRYKEDNVIKIKEYDKEYHAIAYQKSKKKYGNKLRDKWNEGKRKLNQQRRDIVNNIKKEGCCIKCEENRFYVLDFHHINPEEKLFDLGEACKYSKEKILNEISKCVLLCRNCHSEFHYIENEQNITIHEYIDGLF